MKKTIGFSLLVLMAFLNASCSKSNAKTNEITPLASAASEGSAILAPRSNPIPIDQANRMILSYLNGINYTVNTNETRAFFCDADALRNYLNNEAIKQFKFVLAHNMTYISEGGEGKRPGPNQNAITLVIVGVDEANNYVTFPDGTVLDQLKPCPDQCATSGTASNNLITL